jgi:hypothetical protein
VSPSLATIVPGLPNDHYHAFADPMVFTLVGLGAAALWRGPTSANAEAGRLVGRVVAVVGVVALLGWNLANQPPAVHPDGGFPAAEMAAVRIANTTTGGEVTLRSLPDFKSSEAYAYPLVRAGRIVHMARGSVGAGAPGTLVVVCDSLFEEAIGAPCGGPAEARIAPPDRYGQPVDRFEAAPGRTISVYRATD